MSLGAQASFRTGGGVSICRDFRRSRAPGRGWVTCHTAPFGPDNCASWICFRSSRMLRQVSSQACSARRRGDREDGGGASGDNPALGSRGGGPRRRLDRRHRGAGAPDHFRHGRHLGRYRHRHGRAIHRGERPRHVDCRLPAARLDDRHPHHRGGRGFHRPRGSRGRLSGRPAQRRGGAGARRLRARRLRADGNRCERGARTAARGLFPGGRDAARRERRGACPRDAVRNPRALPDRGGRGGAHHRDLQHGQRDPLAHRAEGDRSPRVRPRRVRWGRPPARGGRRTANGLESFDTPFYARDRLPAGERFAGPAIIVQQDSTTVIPPGAEAMAHEHGHLGVQVGDGIGGHT